MLTQFWPEFYGAGWAGAAQSAHEEAAGKALRTHPTWKVPRSTMGSAAGRSASSHRTAASLPPSSRTHGVSVAAAVRATRRPTPGLPVKITCAGGAA